MTGEVARLQSCARMARVIERALAIVFVRENPDLSGNDLSKQLGDGEHLRTATASTTFLADGNGLVRITRAGREVELRIDEKSKSIDHVRDLVALLKPAPVLQRAR